MEVEEHDIVIVGAGIAGLATSLGLHRLGLKSVVLERAEEIRVTGFAFITWTNGWKALDALRVGDLLRRQRPNLQALVVTSAISGDRTSEISLISSKEGRKHESRCIERRVLAEALSKELVEGSIRFSSKLVSIEESSNPNNYYKILHLADGSLLKTKVLIGCDGTNSRVGRWLGLKAPWFTGRCAIRGFVQNYVESSLSSSSKVMQFMGDGVKFGFVPITQTTLYWFFTFSPNSHLDIQYDTEFQHNPMKMKEFVLKKLGSGSDIVRELVEKTQLHEIICSPLKMRLPWDILWGDIAKGNVCITGDAFHPMTPDLGQGACSSLEDGVVLARCLGKAMLVDQQDDADDMKFHTKISMGLNEYGRKRKWRTFCLIATGYAMGFVEQTEWKILQFLRDRVLASYLNGMLLKMAEYDCGPLD